MATLLLRLQAPMQAWGTQSHFRERDAGREPSKSGLIGLLCAALGRPRSEEVADLAALHMGVRVDREGTVQVDFHTAAPPGSREAVMTRRDYMTDAVFLAGLEGEHRLLAHLDTALARPQWQLYLGRKAFPPAAPVRLTDGLRDESLQTALTSYPLLSGGPGPRRFVLDDPHSMEVRSDVPLSFRDRTFATRHVRTDFLEVITQCSSLD